MITSYPDRGGRPFVFGSEVCVRLVTVVDSGALPRARMRAWWFVIGAGCGSNVAELDVMVPELVVATEAVPIRIEARDASGNPVPASEYSISTQPADVAIVEGQTLRCLDHGDAVVVVAGGPVSTQAPVQCRPGAQLVASAPARMWVGAVAEGAFELVEPEGEPVPGVLVQLESSAPEVVEVSGNALRAKAAGTAQVTATVAHLVQTHTVTVSSSTPPELTEWIAALPPDLKNNPTTCVPGVEVPAFREPGAPRAPWVACSVVVDSPGYSGMHTLWLMQFASAAAASVAVQPLLDRGEGMDPGQPGIDKVLVSAWTTGDRLWWITTRALAFEDEGCGIIAARGGTGARGLHHCP